MTSRRSSCFFEICAVCVALFLEVRISRAGEKGAAPDADLPQPMDASVADHLLASPAFTRELDWSQSLVLTGVAYIEGKPIATVYDKNNKKSYVVTAEPNALGWRLGEARASSHIGMTEVELIVGGEKVTVHYGDQQMAPEADHRKYVSLRSGEGYVGHDGQLHIHSAYYLNNEDQQRYRDMAPEVRDKFREIVRSNTDRLLAAPVEERQTFVKQAFDKAQAEAPRAQGR